MTFSALGGGGGGRRSEVTLLRGFFAAQKTFVCLKKATKQTLCSLPTSDMLDIASNSMLKNFYGYFYGNFYGNFDDGFIEMPL